MIHLLQSDITNAEPNKHRLWLLSFSSHLLTHFLVQLKQPHLFTFTMEFEAPAANAPVAPAGAPARGACYSCKLTV